MLGVLCLLCLWGPWPPVQVKGALLEREREVSSTITLLAKDDRSRDFRFYTPTVTNYTSCPHSSLRCFQMEARVLKMELAGVELLQNHSTYIYKCLRGMINMISKVSEEGCGVCEVHPERPADDFLKTLLTVFELMNSS